MLPPGISSAASGVSLPAFTAGPWRVRELSFDGHATIQDAQGNPVAATAYRIDGNWSPRPRGGLPEPEADANAHLIAAAPDLHAALNYVADMTYCGADAEWHFKPGYNPQVVLDALSKALGQPGAGA